MTQIMDRIRIWFSRDSKECQRQQTCQSLERITGAGHASLALAKAENEMAARDAIQAVDRRISDTAPLRDTLNNMFEATRTRKAMEAAAGLVRDRNHARRR